MGVGKEAFTASQCVADALELWLELNHWQNDWKVLMASDWSIVPPRKSQQDQQSSFIDHSLAC